MFCKRTSCALFILQVARQAITERRPRQFRHGKALWFWILTPPHSLYHHVHLFLILAAPTELQQTVSFSKNSCTHLSCNSHSYLQNNNIPFHLIKRNTTAHCWCLIWHKPELGFSSSPVSNSRKGSMKPNLNTTRKSIWLRMFRAYLYHCLVTPQSQ